MKRIAFCLLLALLTCATLAQAQNGGGYWERIPGPDGGRLFDLVQVHQQNTVYGFFQDFDKYLYRSTDGGLHWQRLNVYLNGSDVSDKVYIGRTGAFYFPLDTLVNNVNQKYLYRSEDAGQSWTLVNASAPLNADRLFETETGVLLGVDGQSTDTRVYRSTDGGQTWTESLTMPNSSTIIHVFMFGNGQMMLQQQGLATPYFSNDDGLSWQASSVTTLFRKAWFTPSGALLGHLPAGPLQNRLLRSVDLGQTWDTLPEQTLPISPYLRFTSMVGLPSGRILGKNNEVGAMIISDDDGLSWYLDSVSYQFDDFLQFRPLENGQILAKWGEEMFAISAALDTAVFASHDLPHAELIQFEALNDSVFFAATTNDIYRKLGSNPWEIILEDCSKFRLGHLQNLVAIGSNNDKAFISSDLGQTFRPIEGLNDPGFNQLFTYPPFFGPNDSLMFAAGVSGLYRSSDLGLTWQFVSPIFAIDLYNMAFLPSGRIICHAGNSLFYYSDDNGLNWQALDSNLFSFPPYERQFVSDTSGRLYLLSGIDGNGAVGELLVSEDEGESWTAVKTIGSNLQLYFGCYINSLDHVFVESTDGRLLFSPNGALNWQSLPPLEDELNGLISGMSISSSGRIYVNVLWDYGIYRSTSSTTSGAYLHGAIRRDGDGDCSTHDIQPSALNSWVVEAEGASTYYTTTDNLGRYTMFVDTGSYVLNAQSPQFLWWSVCQTDQPAEVLQLLSADTVDFTALALSDCPLISVGLGATFLRRCFNNEISVIYCNQGTEPADSAWVDIELDPYLDFVQSDQVHLELGGNNLRFFIGDVPSGVCSQFKFTVYVDCDSTVLGQTHCITAHGYPDTLCAGVPNWSGADIRASVACQQDTVVAFRLQNVGGANSALLDYIIIEDDVVMYQGDQQYAPGQSITIPMPANGHTFRIESEQEPGHPFSNLALAFQEGCGGFESLGFINQFTVNGFTPSLYTLCEENTGAYDPNDKQGYPTGTGAEHRIPPGQSIDYRIRFQNTGTDTAFTVVILDTLSAWVEPASIVVGASSHLYDWTLLGNNVLKFTFKNINLPDSSENWEGSQGYVRFRLAQRPDIALGTQIFNKAAIYFDFNEAVITNETVHTIGLPDVVDAQEPTPESTHKVLVTPNPAAEQATFSLREAAHQTYRLQLYDPLGASLGQFTLAEGQWTLPRRHLPAGAYRWVLTNTDGHTLESGVLVFE